MDKLQYRRGGGKKQGLHAEHWGDWARSDANAALHCVRGLIEDDVTLMCAHERRDRESHCQ
jgi:hypothetical protein